VVRKYEDSIVAASKKSCNVRQLMQKIIGFNLVLWWTGELTIMRKKFTQFEGDTSEGYRTATCVKPGNSNTCRRKGSTKPL